MRAKYCDDSARATCFPFTEHALINEPMQHGTQR